ncbi:MAG: hypothetical protein WCG25_02410 [bacterium]
MVNCALPTKVRSTTHLIVELDSLNRAGIVVLYIGLGNVASHVWTTPFTMIIVPVFIVIFTDQELIVFISSVSQSKFQLQ